MAKIDVALCFDVEDYYHGPEVGSDTIIKELADLMTEEGVRGNFFFIGIRARLLKERGRFDVIDALRPHAIGHHTLTGEHPCLPEYCAGKDWWEGVAEARRREAEGCQMLRDTFGRDPACISQHASYAAPQVFAVAREMGVPYVYGPPAAPPHYSLSWYCGALNLPYGEYYPNFLAYFEPYDHVYSDPQDFNQAMASLERHIAALVEHGQQYLTFFVCHPYHLRVVEFVDFFMHTSGVNVPREQWAKRPRPHLRSASQMELTWANLRRLMRYLARHEAVNIVTVPELQAKYGTQPREIPRTELFSAALEVSAAPYSGFYPVSGWRARGQRPRIPTGRRFSPAETVVGLADSILAFARGEGLPAAVSRVEVLGPMENPITTPEVFEISWDGFVCLCGELRDWVTRRGYLPHDLGPRGQRVGLGTLYRALAEAYCALAEGTVPSVVELRHFPRIPEEGVLLGHAYQDIIDQAMMDPSLDTGRLVHYARLQSWTLKPAYPPGGELA